MMECGYERLMAESTFVKGIADKTDAEDGDGKGVTGSERIAIEGAGENFVVIFLAGDKADKLFQLYC